MFSAGKFNIEDSSLIVPLSDKTTLACILNLHNHESQMALLNEHVGEIGATASARFVYVGELIQQPGDHAPLLMHLASKRV